MWSKLNLTKGKKCNKFFTGSKDSQKIGAKKEARSQKSQSTTKKALFILHRLN